MYIKSSHITKKKYIEGKTKEIIQIYYVYIDIHI